MRLEMELDMGTPLSIAMGTLLIYATPGKNTTIISSMMPENVAQIPTRFKTLANQILKPVL